MFKRIMVQCRSEVKKDAVTHKIIDGVEHLIISSSTLPDNIVMNGILYPSEEIANSFETLEGTLAPIEHPKIDGVYLPANDARAIHKFHAGAFNTNVRRENGRVHVDKVINVQEALKTDRGKRLLDRANELEASEKPRPIHTSVGVFLSLEELDEPRTSADGQEYLGIAREMIFDHDAILLDSVGSAQPHQGVGMAVNSRGEEIEIHTFNLDANHEQSAGDLSQAVFTALEKSAFSVGFMEELFPDHVIFWSNENLFDVSFVVDEQGVATIVGIPLLVERNVTFIPKTNHQEGDEMKKMIINALKAAGVEVAGMSDEQLLEAHMKLNIEGNPAANEEMATMIANAVTDTVATLTSEIAGIKATQEAGKVAEVEEMAALIANSGKYPGLDAVSAKILPTEKLKEMAANCQPSYGLSPLVNAVGQNETFSVPTDMPE